MNVHKNLVEMGVRLELQPQSHGKQTYLPLVCHTLPKFEKIVFVSVCEELKYHKYTLQISKASSQWNI